MCTPSQMRCEATPTEPRSNPYDFRQDGSESRFGRPRLRRVGSARSSRIEPRAVLIDLVRKLVRGEDKSVATRGINLMQIAASVSDEERFSY